MEKQHLNDTMNECYGNKIKTNDGSIFFLCPRVNIPLTPNILSKQSEVTDECCVFSILCYYLRNDYDSTHLFLSTSCRYYRYIGPTMNECYGNKSKTNCVCFLLCV